MSESGKKGVLLLVKKKANNHSTLQSVDHTFLCSIWGFIRALIFKKPLSSIASELAMIVFASCVTAM